MVQVHIAMFFINILYRIQLGLCNNRNSHITIILLDITIITIVDPLLYVCMKFTKTLLNVPVVFFIIIMLSTISSA